MKLYLIKKNSDINATANYDVTEKKFTVLKGSVISSTISTAGKFKSAKSIEKTRAGIVENNVLSCDVTFKSPSTAANFVLGTSTNGLLVWKDKNGKALKEIIGDMEERK